MIFRYINCTVARPILQVASTLVLIGCGATPARERTATESARSRAVVTYTSTIARNTQSATARRRGDWSLTSEKVRNVSDIVRRYAATYGLSEDLVYGIIWVESRFDPRAVSPVGARGLMQLMPKTASYLADCIDWSGRVDSFDPEFNIHAGSYYISRLVREFGGDEDLALAAYNAGPAKVRRWLADDGLPKVSIEYATMVQTARTFFTREGRAPSRAAGTSETASRTPATVISDEALDRLGLAILIAGLETRTVGLDREDDPTPFN